MKNLLFVLLLFPIFAFANQGTPALEAIKAALAAGDTETLSKYLADNVEISIEDNEQRYNKSQAADALRQFFNGAKPKGFAQVHKGTSRESSDQYCIGNLSGSTGAYRVYLYLKVAGNGLLIQEIRFDKE